MTPKLCLGTAQLGFNYGITNNSGKVDHSMSKLILEKAVKYGIQYIDTAQSYGDAEDILGRISSSLRNLSIITKFTPNLSGTWHSSDIEIWEECFKLSLKKLKVNKIDSFLVHNHQAFIRSDSNILIEWLESLKERSLIRRIGVSIYDVNDIDVLPLNKLEIVQVPLSIYDQRFIKYGGIDYLISSGLNVHVRSIFLQGLLLQPISKWPDFISREFKDHHFKLYRNLKKNNIDPLLASLGFIYRCSDIEAVLFGVTNTSELCSIISNWQSLSSLKNQELPYGDSSWAWDQANDIDPRNWLKYLNN
tara:strand:- start:623 stop:1537 length:915 start_codon:yes stop_codon:yes gene_type:complete